MRAPSTTSHLNLHLVTADENMSTVYFIILKDSVANSLLQSVGLVLYNAGQSQFRAYDLPRPTMTGEE